MSKNEWERGSIKLPSRDWVKSRKKFMEGYNLHQNHLQWAAGKLHEILAGKNTSWKPPADLKARLKLWKSNGSLDENVTHLVASADYSFREKFRSLGHEVRYNIIEAVIDFTGARVKLKKPPRNLFPLANSKTRQYHEDHGEAGILFDDAEKTLRWSVGENNHAVDRAHEGLLYRLMNEVLKDVKWTRGTGGWFTGNDEYNQERSGAGEGGNYITRSIGPLGEENQISDYRQRGFSLKRAKELVKPKAPSSSRYPYR